MDLPQGFARIVVFLVVGAAVGAGLYFVSRGDVPPDDPAALSEEEIVAAVASSGFQKLDIQQRQTYLTRLRDAEGGRDAMRARVDTMSDEQRDQFRDNMRSTFRASRDAHIEQYFDLKTPTEKTAYLDQTIDQMLERRKQWEARRAEREATGDTAAGDRPRGGPGTGTRRGGPGGAGGMPDPNRIKNRVESADPAMRAMHEQFREDLRARAEERGIELRRPGRPGR